MAIAWIKISILLHYFYKKINCYFFNIKNNGKVKQINEISQITISLKKANNFNKIVEEQLNKWLSKKKY